MNELPILFMSKESPGREGIAERTLNALAANLYTWTIPKTIFFSIAGSYDYFEKLKNISNEIGFKVNGTITNKFNRSSTAGEAWNDSLKLLFDSGHEMYLRMEDDFLLNDIMNVKRYIELLESNDKVGMVRLGLMPINLNLRSVGWYDKDNQGHIFFDCLPTSPYAYSGNPGLIHKRMHDQVGYFHETHNPGDIEIDFDSRVRQNMVNGGCRIWYPLELGKYGTYGAFSHIGDVKSY